MKLLLDTHAILWFEEGSRKLGPKARAMIEDRALEVWLSAASVWEIATKSARGRLRMRRQLGDWLPEKMRENAISPLSVTHEHAITAAELPRYHEDPFDRMLIAQAQVEDLRIVTADAQFERYAVRLIDATV